MGAIVAMSGGGRKQRAAKKQSIELGWIEQRMLGDRVAPPWL